MLTLVTGCSCSDSTPNGRVPPSNSPPAPSMSPTFRLEGRAVTCSGTPVVGACVVLSSLGRRGMQRDLGHIASVSGTAAVQSAHAALWATRGMEVIEDVCERRSEVDGHFRLEVPFACVPRTLGVAVCSGGDEAPCCGLSTIYDYDYAGSPHLDVGEILAERLFRLSISACTARDVVVGAHVSVQWDGPGHEVSNRYRVANANTNKDGVAHLLVDSERVVVSIESPGLGTTHDEVEFMESETLVRRILSAESTISGAVTETDGRAVAFAGVAVYEILPSDRVLGLTAQAVSDIDGHFVLRHIATDRRYSVVVAKPTDVRLARFSTTISAPFHDLNITMKIENQPK